MPQNPPAGMTRITPYLFYRDVAAALAWLEDTVGMQRGGELLGPDGTIVHAEMSFKDGVIMMGAATAESGGASPADLGGITQSIYIYVDDVDAHYRHTVSCGVVEVDEPQDMFWGDRMYAVKDPEGHRWAFAQHTKDIPPEEMNPGW